MKKREDDVMMKLLNSGDDTVVATYQRARGVVAHYDYAPFGAVTSASIGL